MGLKAVLFDMDGTLVDSVPAWHMAFNSVLKLHGKPPVSYEYFCTDILGQSAQADIDRFFPSLSVAGLTGHYERFFPESISTVRLFPATLTVLEYLDSRGLKTGVVTNTPRGLMEQILETVGLSGRFGSAISVDDVPSGKPQPDMIHRSCEILRIEEKDALMVGDTMMDVEAAKKAGMLSVGVGIQGDLMIRDIGELPKLMDGLGL
ncbi:MAG: HAD family hydrolase [Candidatus Altiarchaeota archaeon]